MNKDLKGTHIKTISGEDAQDNLYDKYSHNEITADDIAATVTEDEIRLAEGDYTETIPSRWNPVLTKDGKYAVVFDQFCGEPWCCDIYMVK